MSRPSNFQERLQKRQGATDLQPHSIPTGSFDWDHELSKVNISSPLAG